ncbi:MAG: serine hydrolase [Eubacteriales bacterium]
MKNNRKPGAGMVVVLAGLILTVAIGGGTVVHLYRKNSDESAAASVKIRTLMDDILDLESEINDLNCRIADLQSAHEDFKEDYTDLQSDVADITDELSAKEAELEIAEAELEVRNLRITVLEKRLNQQISKYDTAVIEKERLAGETEKLKEQIAVLREEIEALQASPDEISTVDASVDSVVDSEVPPQDDPSRPAFEPVPFFEDPADRLWYLLQYGAPERWYEVAGEAGEYYLAYPKIIAYGYYDLTSGEQIGYHADNVYYSASLIKAPYIYSVLREISDFEKTKTERDEDGRIVYLPGEEKYNLDEVWTYDAATMLEEGSGEIQEMPDGTQMTWRELFEYTLLYSDNVAFAQIRERFGMTSFWNLVDELELAGPPTGFMNLSVSDCLKFLRELYAFFETDDPYAQFMKENMMKSKHTVMICASFEPGTVPHKYGWDKDAYHDMAILYDEHPYVLVLMTDLHDGEKQDNDYIHALVETTKEIHAAKYAE